MMIAECIQACMSILKPILTANKQSVAKGKVVMGSIQGDVHDIGRQIVGSMFTASGYEVFDLGYDIAPKKFAMEARRKNVTVVGIHCSLTASRQFLPEIRKELNKVGLTKDKVGTILGGQATYKEDTKGLDVDAWGGNSSEAMTQIDEISRILKESKKN
jgi:methylmalonyl-CoA mutase cobalamin-binding domain/chain